MFCLWLFFLWFFARSNSFPNSLAHKLPFSRRARPSVGCFFVCFLLFWFCGCSLFGWSSFFLFDTPVWTCWIVHWSTLSFDSPMRDIQDFVQFVQWHKHCVTTWREPRRRRTEKNCGCSCLWFLGFVVVFVFSVLCLTSSMGRYWTV